MNNSPNISIAEHNESCILPGREKILSVLKKERFYLKEEFKVSEIGLFGSYIRDERFRKRY